MHNDRLLDRISSDHSIKHPAFSPVSSVCNGNSADASAAEHSFLMARHCWGAQGAPCHQSLFPSHISITVAPHIILRVLQLAALEIHEGLHASTELRH